jgi:amino acid permease
VTVAVGVQDRPDAAPQVGEWKSDYKLVNSPTFADAISAISAFVFAYAGTPVFFPIAAEMREPRHYKKALFLCQAVVTVTYIVVGIVVYYYCGTYVASPALGSAGKTIKKISYGLALPGLIVSACLYTHVSIIHTGQIGTGCQH